jgi:hypothetical protein
VQARKLTIAVLVLGGILASPSTALGAKGLEVGLQDQPVFVERGYGDREAALQMAGQLRVSWLRVDVAWAKALGAQAASKTVPSPMSYDWSAYDSAIDAAARHGIRVELDLTGPAPAFATAGGHIGPVRPNAARYAEFVRAAAAHFKGRVGRYMIWNEPNGGAWLGPLAAAPRLYRSLFQAGYREVKRVDPGAQVLIGMTIPYAIHGRATAPLRFLRELTCVSHDYRRRRCPGLVADGYAQVPFDFTLPIGPPDRGYPPQSCLRRSARERRLLCPDGQNAVTLGTLGRLTRALTRLARSGALRTPGGRPLDVYLDEYGYFRIGKRHIRESVRARYMRQAFQIAQRNPRVRQLLQYGLVEPPRGYSGSFFDTTIVAPDGTPRQTFLTLAAWAQRAAAGGLVKSPGGPLALPPPPP